MRKNCYKIVACFTLNFKVVYEIQTTMPKLLFLFLIISQNVKLFSAKQSLQTVMTFEEMSEYEKSNSRIERGRKAEERINLSFPGTKW